MRVVPLYYLLKILMFYEKELLSVLVLTSFNYFSIIIPLLGVMFC
jgi:hypothetical protein